jgi:hypothetical protein
VLSGLGCLWGCDQACDPPTCLPFTKDVSSEATTSISTRESPKCKRASVWSSFRVDQSEVRLQRGGRFPLFVVKPSLVRHNPPRSLQVITLVMWRARAIPRSNMSSVRSWLHVLFLSFLALAVMWAVGTTYNRKAREIAANKHIIYRSARLVGWQYLASPSPSLRLL